MPPPALPLTTLSMSVTSAEEKMPPPPCPPLTELPEIVLSVIVSGPSLLMAPPKLPVLSVIVRTGDRQCAQVIENRGAKRPVPDASALPVTTQSESVSVP